MTLAEEGRPATPSPEPPVRAVSRDLRLPVWGPYSKRYVGTSHLADPARGTRWDFSVVPGYFRGDLLVPDGLRPSRFHPWEAAPGLLHYSFRHQLEWKDQVVCDVSFTALDEHSRLVSCEWVNATDHTQRLVPHAVTSLDFARIGPHQERLRTAHLRAPGGVTWVDAVDYVHLHLVAERRDRGLVADGLLVGEQRAHDAVGGSVLTGVGDSEGDAVEYTVALRTTLEDAVLRLRYRLPAGAGGRLRVHGFSGGELHCSGEGRMRTTDLDVGALPAGAHRFTLQAPRGALDGLELDGLLIGEREALERTVVEPESLSTEVCITDAPGGGVVIEPKALGQAYGVAWAGGEAGRQAAAREFVGTDLDLLLRGAKLDRHGDPVPSSGAPEAEESAERFLVVPGPAVLVPPRSRRTVHGIVCDGSPGEVAEHLARFRGTSAEELGALLADGRRTRFEPLQGPTAARTDTALVRSQRRMAATVLTNIVHPIYLRREHVRHFTPGRWWDSLYTWDSGMIGLGLVEIDPRSARDCLEAYLTGPEDPHSAYIHHGTTLPTQQQLAAELLSRDGDRERFARWYPGLREQYRFLSGSHPRSRTRMSSGLLNPFAHFYNSGGWDDYPAQLATHARGLSRTVAPMVTTSHAILSAKLLLLATADAPQDERSTRAEGHRDVDEYIEDIGRMTAAVQRCWDPEAGYFGYAVHDEDGEITGLLRDEDGVDLNLGLDGVQPLIAGACTPEQVEVLLERLFSPEHLWSDIGISTVDRSAPYYEDTGYWNGQVWIAHQWFLSRALLDLGRPDLAHRLAEAVLGAWTAESERTYDTWEHFSIATGRGGGWHHFGGLSAPVLNLYATFYRPGSLTTGFGTRVLERRVETDATALTAELLSLPASQGRASAVVRLEPGNRYEALVDGRPVQVDEAGDGLLHVTWKSDADPDRPFSPARRTLEVRPREPQNFRRCPTNDPAQEERS